MYIIYFIRLFFIIFLLHFISEQKVMNEYNSNYVKTVCKLSYNTRVKLLLTDKQVKKNYKKKIL